MIKLLISNRNVLIDECDLELVSQYKWRIIERKGYCQVLTGNQFTKHAQVSLARLLLSPLDGMWVDHINGDPLDNRRCNLRLATPKDNARNRKPRAGSKSGLKGVKWHKQHQRWQAGICVNGEFFSLGMYDDPNEAAHAYNERAKVEFGEFARLNEVP